MEERLLTKNCRFMKNSLLGLPRGVFYMVLGLSFAYLTIEAVAQRCSVKKMFLEISQNLQENICARVSF